jgi:hypothetical protein
MCLQCQGDAEAAREAATRAAEQAREAAPEAESDEPGVLRRVLAKAF